MSITYKMSRDTNGNTTVKITSPYFRGFSIQTNGNLPKTHSDHEPDHSEIMVYIHDYGTKRQRSFFGW